MNSIEAMLPHRPPFLFVDEVVELSEDRVVARRTVRADEPHFAGHYPGRPVMPGVLLCEAILQAGCCLMVSKGADGATLPEDGSVPVVARIREAKFKRMVKPGDVLDLIAKHERTVRGAHFLSGEARVGGQLAATLSFVVMMAPP